MLDHFVVRNADFEKLIAANLIIEFEVESNHVISGIKENTGKTSLSGNIFGIYH